MLYENLKRFYSVQKTLRFELKPVGKTKENIEKKGIIANDYHRFETYKNVKKYCDEYHKYFINEALKNVKLKNLEEYYKLFISSNKTEDKKEKLEEIEESLRKELSDLFIKNPNYKKLFSKELIQKHLIELYKEDEDKKIEIEEFNKFTTYFSGYNLNRQNMYVSEKKSTAIAYRMINDNLPIFINNIKIFDKLKTVDNTIIEKVENDLKEYLQVNNLEDMFKINYFNETLTQIGIEVYNIMISGKSKENDKIKGLNEYINEYNQVHQEKNPKFKELYKQILSDSQTASFIYESIDNDLELINIISNYYEDFRYNIQHINDLLINIEKYDTNKIFINNNLSITDISQKIYGDWNYISSRIIENFDENYLGNFSVNTEKYEEFRKKELKKKKIISIYEIEKIVNDKLISSYLKDYLNNYNIIEDIENKYIKFNNVKDKFSTNEKIIIKDEQFIQIIKELLDEVMEVKSFINIIIPKDKTAEKDELFYNEYINYYEKINEITPIYNKIRNYVTQKPYSTEKIKINFECPTLLDGWDKNKEKSNLGVILIKDNKYYLGIMNATTKNIFDKEISGNSNYLKMDYKQLSGINKQLPRIAFSKSRIDEFNPSKELLEKYQKGLHKKGDNFDINFCHELIDFFKHVIKINPDWKMYNTNFSITESYNDISEFYKEVDEQLYCIQFSKFDENYIEDLVNNGSLYLFQIYNKDFSEYSKGKQNLHTLYWKALFDEDNLKNVVYKLNGNAEIFYRKASLKLEETAIHKANKPVKNKNTDTIKNGKEYSIFEYDLIKNKRYTIDKFQMNVPITCNYINQGISNINSIVNKYLKESEQTYVIGIDRGERNLLYITLIDNKGKILYQESLNKIISEYNNIKYETDYHYLLDTKEKERENARESWKTIENIKELKEGYMSQVIHIITKLMQQYNAIIVLEDLNIGFKNSRIKVEKQVYQKFEKMLIEKLNYLIFKDVDKHDNGGLLEAFQLTNKFESFNKMGKQSGILFYIPAWNTSKIDPVTGFVNLFSLKYVSVEKSKEFVKKIDKITFNKDKNYFEFDIDYKKYTYKAEGTKEKWKICSYGNRVKTFRNPEKNNQFDCKEIELTEEFKKLFTNSSIDFYSNNLKEEMLKNENKVFWESFINLFKIMLQMRNSITGTKIDYIISPVANKDGEFFDSRKSNYTLPKDADANGAYNIARKGLMILEQIKETDYERLGKVKFDITNKKWLSFVQRG